MRELTGSAPETIFTDHVDRAEMDPEGAGPRIRSAIVEIYHRGGRDYHQRRFLGRSLKVNVGVRGISFPNQPAAAGAADGHVVVRMLT